MLCPGPVAFFFARLQRVARRGALRIDTAHDLFSYVAAQRDTARRGLIGTAHATEPGVDLIGEVRRQTQVVGLGPIEGYAKGGAARAAIQAGMVRGGSAFTHRM